MRLEYVAAVLVLVIVSIAVVSVTNITGFILGAGKTVTVDIEKGDSSLSFETAAEPAESAFDCLKHVATVEYEIYPTGVYVEAIDGLKQDPDHFWVCFVNGEFPEVGCDYYTPNDGDVISYRYMSADEIAGYF